MHFSVRFQQIEEKEEAIAIEQKKDDLYVNGAGDVDSANSIRCESYELGIWKVDQNICHGQGDGRQSKTVGERK